MTRRARQGLLLALLWASAASASERRAGLGPGLAAARGSAPVAGFWRRQADRLVRLFDAPPPPPPARRTLGTQPTLTLLALHGLASAPDDAVLKRVLDGVEAQGISAEVVTPHLRWETPRTRRAEQVAALAQGSALPVIVVAHSQAGELTQALSADPNVRGIVALGPVLRPRQTLEAPMLLLHGSRDRNIPIARSREFAESHSQVELIEYAGAGHKFAQREAPLGPEGVPRLTTPEISRDIAQRTADFIRRRGL